MAQYLGLTILHTSADEGGSLPIKKPVDSKQKTKNLDLENQIWKLFLMVLHEEKGPEWE